MEEILKNYKMLSCGIIFWIACGCWHLINFFADGIYQEAFENSYTWEAPMHRHWVIIPNLKRFWFVIIPFCIICGPFARMTAKKFLGLEYEIPEDVG